MEIRKIPAVEAQTPDKREGPPVAYCPEVPWLKATRVGLKEIRLLSLPTNGVDLTTLAASPALKSVRERTVPPRQEAVPV